MTIVTDIINKSEKYDDEIMKNNDEEKNIKVSDELKIRLNMMFETLREEGMNCFIKDKLKCSLLNQTTLSALCEKLWKSITVLFNKSVSSTARAQELITITQVKKTIDNEDDKEKCCTHNSRDLEII